MKKLFFVLSFFYSFVLGARQLEEPVKRSEDESVSRISNADVNFQLPRFIFTYTNTRIIVKFNNPAHPKLVGNHYELDFIVNGAAQKVSFDNNGLGSFYFTFKDNTPLRVLIEDVNYTVQPPLISIWYILGPLAFMALFFMYRLLSSVRKNRVPKLVVKRNDEVYPDLKNDFVSNLKVVRVKEVEEEV